MSKVRFATRPGSFILTLALPLVETFDDLPPVSGHNDALRADTSQ